ncbi:MAG: aminotransferase class I/II-fold pyridoxal phosphate-dependent enzyme [Streptosporangiales bacterium]|nr:aminotransferase class I/II-fold pyridoxal phosphate-dependent enzyme [Streptosporangiales bacterium]
MAAHSATLAINERIQARRARGEKVLHLGFGEAGLPVLPAVADVLSSAVAGNAYGPVVGSLAARDAAAGYFTRRGLATHADQIVLAPGSKALLYALLTVLRGDVVLPVPSWVTYAAQAALAGKRVIDVPVPPEAGGVPDPDRLDEVLRTARAVGAEPGILVLTLPDNPTGTLAGADLVRRVCEVAERNGLVVVSDEIYRDLTYAPETFAGPATFLPDRTFVTSGLSKSMALGGWRIGFSRVPATDWGAEVRDEIVGVASEVWSSLATPMQDAAAYVLGEPAEVTAHVAASRRLHQRVSVAVHETFTAAGAVCRPPQGCFYVYPDLEVVRPVLAARGVDTGARLAEHLLDTHAVGVLAGEAFGDDPRAFRFRVATSLLYGEGDQRWDALNADDPVSLPWIAAALADLDAALRAVTSG